ncbi:phage portal protein [Weissella ceti]|uniref:Phage portal protein n=1 Tax=Weissella ceti TaxID=759620 RepID=A0ABT3E4A6_9LACO|nr:phage portal protein [Weissella ceti]MCW0953253.1 phage portal protein [Weissella ceti]QVK12769.1 phage portal protein [Weissella ceti]
MNWFSKLVLKGNSRDPSSDEIVINDFFTGVRSSLTDYGMTIVANYIARSFMSVKADVERKAVYKRLNVAPNKNQNASEFWRDVVYKLVNENEVLVVTNSSKELLIADSFTVEESTNYGNKYKHVTVGEFTFKREFKHEDVWHMTLSSEMWQRNFDNFNRELDALYAYIMGNAKRKNQLRALLKVEGNNNFAKENEAEIMSKTISKIRKSVETNEVAIIPQLKGLSYEEQNFKSGVNQSFGADELAKLKKMVVLDAASVLGIPVALLYGEQADNSGALATYRQNVVRPILTLLNSEVEQKLGMEIKMSFHHDHSIFEMAEQADKLISSGVLTRNMVAGYFDLPPVEGGDEFVLTKNYAAKGEEE